MAKYIKKTLKKTYRKYKRRRYPLGRKHRPLRKRKAMVRTIKKTINSMADTKYNLLAY